MITFNSNYSFSVKERLIRYVQVDTQSDPHNDSFPSSEKQKNLSAILAEELRALGLADAHMDEFGYVYATVSANCDNPTPVVCFCSHVDTAPDCSGTNVKPLVHTNYDGSPIVLPDDSTQILTTEKYPYLKEKIGNDIITASGQTLLGADDKSGVAIIMDLVQYLQQHPEVEHGTIKILFTPDEETGRGTEKVDLKKLGADIGFTLDGGEAGDLEDETFSADAVSITVHGVSAHPGYAKDKMVNALKIAGEILAALPKDSWSPETTEAKQGFVHPVSMQGIAEKATIDFIIRSFVTSELAEFENRLKNIAAEIVGNHHGATMEFSIREQYRNMKEVLDQHPGIIANARKAIEMAGLTPRQLPIRGGTDGSRLSFMGLPCPNLFTGMQGIHSRTEWISVHDMQKGVEVLVYLVQSFCINSK
jgi:tripeptide aminopeptidase